MEGNVTVTQQESDFLQQANAEYAKDPGQAITLSKLKGTGVCRDKDGNLLDREGNIVAPQHESG